MLSALFQSRHGNLTDLFQLFGSLSKNTPLIACVALIGLYQLNPVFLKITKRYLLISKRYLVNSLWKHQSAAPNTDRHHHEV